MNRRIIITIGDNVTDIEAIQLIRKVVVNGGNQYQGIYTFKGSEAIVAANLKNTKSTTFYVQKEQLNNQ
jgi:hypothetical protein